MLLSFAQFEREVSSERVRDKIRASKAKGLWMGSWAPLGYDVIDKKLIPNPQEVRIITEIFETYLKVSSLNELRLKLMERNIKAKFYKTSKGTTRGGDFMETSQLSRILNDPICIGKISNKSSNDVFDGVHEPIISKELWKQVQNKLKDNNHRKDSKVNIGRYLLHNKIISADGTIFKNMKTSKTQNRFSYRYYTMPNFYLPAGDIDNITREVVENFLNSNMDILPKSTKMAFKQIGYNDKLIKNLITKIIYQDDKLTYFINISDTDYLKPFINEETLNIKSEKLEGAYLSEDKKHLIIDKPIILQKGIALSNQYSDGSKTIATKKENATTLIKALSIAWRYKKVYERGTLVTEIMKQEKLTNRTVYKYLNLAYLSPKIINDIMDSNIPNHINLQTIFEIASKYESFRKQERAFYNL